MEALEAAIPAPAPGPLTGTLSCLRAPFCLQLKPNGRQGSCWLSKTTIDYAWLIGCPRREPLRYLRAVATFAVASEQRALFKGQADDPFIVGEAICKCACLLQPMGQVHLAAAGSSAALLHANGGEGSLPSHNKQMPR